MIREVEGLRGIRTLIVLGAITVAAYVVYRVRTSRRGRVPVGGSPIPTARFEPASFASEPPAEAVAMVAPVDGTLTTAVTRPDSNGSASPVGPEPGPVRKSALGPVELPRKRRPSAATLAALAALLGVAAIALGTTALVSSLNSDDATEAVPQIATVSEAERAISLLSKPSTKRMPVANSGGRIILAIGANGRGALILDGLGTPSAGKAYQAWVIKPKAKAPLSAALFSGIETIVPLSVSVKAGSVVAITIERAGGVPAPTQSPKLVAQPAT